VIRGGGGRTFLVGVVPLRGGGGWATHLDDNLLFSQRGGGGKSRNGGKKTINFKGRKILVDNGSTYKEERRGGGEIGVKSSTRGKNYTRARVTGGYKRLKPLTITKGEKGKGVIPRVQKTMSNANRQEKGQKSRSRRNIRIRKDMGVGKQ